MVLEKDREKSIEPIVREMKKYYKKSKRRFISYIIKRIKAEWIGYILRRNCILKHVIEGKMEGRIEVTERRGSRRRILLNDFKKRRSYWELNTRRWISLCGEFALEEIMEL